MVANPNGRVWPKNEDLLSIATDYLALKIRPQMAQMTQIGEKFAQFV